MRILLAALTVCSCIVTFDVHAAQPCTARSDPAAPGANYSEEVGVVEDVISLERDGYQFRSYVVGWHGSRVLVSDPLVQTALVEGATLHFIAIRTKLPSGKLLLDFVSTERRDRPATPRTEPPLRHSVDGSSVTASGTIEDILSAQDGGYRFIGYVVRYNGQRVALVDHDLQEAAHALGDEISFVEVRTAISQQGLMGFQMLPHGSRAASNTGLGDRTESESGVVTEVLSAENDGYRYRAYVVQWHEGELLLPDQSARTDYRVGDTLSFTARHLQAPRWLVLSTSSLRPPPEPPQISRPARLDRSLQKPHRPLSTKSCLGTSMEIATVLISWIGTDTVWGSPTSSLLRISWSGSTSRCR